MILNNLWIASRGIALPEVIEFQNQFAAFRRDFLFERQRFSRTRRWSHSFLSGILVNLRAYSFIQWWSGIGMHELSVVMDQLSQFAPFVFRKETGYDILGKSFKGLQRSIKIIAIPSYNQTLNREMR
jgi:hypothetical protein